MAKKRITCKACPPEGCPNQASIEPGRRPSRAYARLKVHGPVGVVVMSMVYYGMKIADEVSQLIHTGLGGIT
ncbi:hypothetical protein [Streptomyces sp. BF23-19]|uniref:hypothetical protein n=1 Tax=unclassified Streptomyces TaxID=2593676 RepID=UPI0034E42EEB